MYQKDESTNSMVYTKKSKKREYYLCNHKYPMNFCMKGTKNLSKKRARIASSPTENQRQKLNRTISSAEGDYLIDFVLYCNILLWFFIDCLQKVLYCM